MKRRKNKLSRKPKKLTRSHKPKFTRKNPPQYVVIPYGSCRYFKDVFLWSKDPQLMGYSKAKILKAKLDLKLYGNFIIIPIK